MRREHESVTGYVHHVMTLEYRPCVPGVWVTSVIECIQATSNERVIEGPDRKESLETRKEQTSGWSTSKMIRIMLKGLYDQLPRWLTAHDKDYVKGIVWLTAHDKDPCLWKWPVQRVARTFPPLPSSKRDYSQRFLSGLGLGLGSGHHQKENILIDS